MDLWMIMRERYLLLSLLTIIILASLFLLRGVWKNRSRLPKMLTVTTIFLYVLLIIISLFSLVFIVSFGVNS